MTDSHCTRCGDWLDPTELGCACHLHRPDRPDRTEDPTMTDPLLADAMRALQAATDDVGATSLAVVAVHVIRTRYRFDGDAVAAAESLHALADAMRADAAQVPA